MGPTDSGGVEGSASATPHVYLASPSRSADAGHLASADIAKIASEAGIEFRLVGGNAVSLLTWVHGATGLAPDRETNDADLGVPAQAVGADPLLEALLRHEYHQVDGNRFSKEIDHGGSRLDLQIDILVPSHSGLIVNNHPFGDLVVDAIPGLAVAIARPPTPLRVSATLTTGEELGYEIQLPDVIAALCMKAYAYRWRSSERDALDIWRLLEIAQHLKMSTSNWPAGASGLDTAKILHRHFGQVASAGTGKAAVDRAAQARIRALVAAIVPPPSAGSD